MLVLDVFYTALATIGVMVILQIVVYIANRLMYPPEPKVVYVQAPQPVVSQPVQQPQFPVTSAPPAFTQQSQDEIKLPEYEPRKPATTSLRMDPELPPGLQETRPPGT